MAVRPDVSAERRAEIVRAALTCFKRRGYLNTTVDDIAAESGLSKGSLYWYFGSKQEMLAAALDAVLSKASEELAGLLAGCANATEKIRTMAEAAAQFGKAADGYFQLFLEYWAQSSDRKKASRLWVDVLGSYHALLTGIIREGIRHREFRTSDAGHLAWALMATYDGLATYKVLMPGLDPVRASRALRETLLRGMDATLRALDNRTPTRVLTMSAGGSDGRHSRRG